ncbi:MAG TPA: hypothetical protein VGN57_17785 [Pirellulaceae bacterium]|jgi:heme/copper-type cytochrome/quinol oxidase subunit 2|nr:hypothetical protein [Pirellulaceae bacterium]
MDERDDRDLYPAALPPRAEPDQPKQHASLSGTFLVLALIVVVFAVVCALLAAIAIA